MLELKILSLLTKKQAYEKYRRLIGSPDGLSVDTRRFLRAVDTVFTENSTNTAKLSVVTSHARSLGGDAETDKFIKEVYQSGKGLKESQLPTMVQEFLKRRFLRNFILDLSNQVENPEAKINIGAMQNILGQYSEQLDTIHQRELVVPYLQVTPKLSDYIRPGIAPTGLPSVDHAVRGGLASGELGVIMMPTNIGKTLMSICLGSYAMSAGLRVAHITTEDLPQALVLRYDQNLTGLSIERLLGRGGPKIAKKAREAHRRAGGDLRLMDYTGIKPTLMDIELGLREYTPQLVIVDSADDIHPPRIKREDLGESWDVYQSLRRMSRKLRCPVWVTTQTNREGMKMESTGLEFVSRDISKVQIAHVVLAGQPSSRLEGGLKLKVAKNKIWSPKPLIQIEVNPETHRIKEIPKRGEDNFS